MDIPVNMWAVLVAAVASMVVGSLWYSPILFGKKWTKLMGWDSPEKMALMKQGAGKAYTVMFLSSIIMAYVLAHFVQLVPAVTESDALQLAFWVWLGFVATVGIGNVLFEKRPFGLFLINSLYYLVNISVMACILTLWQ